MDVGNVPAVKEHFNPRSLPVNSANGVRHENSIDSVAPTTDGGIPPVQPSPDGASGGSNDGRDEIEPISSIKCGCFSPDEGHFENFNNFQEKVNEALQKLPPQQTQYDRVRALIINWEESDVPELSKYAGDLGKLLKQDYGFEVDSHVIKNGESQDNGDIRLEFRYKITDTIRSISDRKKNNLLIVYYGGHGVQLTEKNKPSRRVWAPTATSKTYLSWTDFQSDLRVSAYCDILFLFDCCYALAMIDSDETYQRRCEIFCASGALDRASAKRTCSFTKAITEELSIRKDSNGIDVLWFKTMMTSTEMAEKHKLSPAPQWRRYSDTLHQTSIFLESKNQKLPVSKETTTHNDEDSGKFIETSLTELDSLSDTRVLVKLRLANPAELLLEDDWMKWFQQRPSNVAGIEIAIVKRIRCHGLFKSDSSLLLLSMPVWVWENIQADPACESIGIVRSDNLLPLQVASKIGVSAEKAQGAPVSDEKERLLRDAGKALQQKQLEAAERERIMAEKGRVTAARLEERERKVEERERRAAQTEYMNLESARAKEAKWAKRDAQSKRDRELSLRSKARRMRDDTPSRSQRVAVPKIKLNISVHESLLRSIPNTLVSELVGRRTGRLKNERW